MENEGRRYFSSRVIDDLDARIRTTASNQERNVLFAKKAFALARHSLVPEARKLVQDLRQINKDYEPQLSAWIMFAEGVIEHSERLDLVKSRDRIYRAYLVGQAANDPSLAATSAAWLADFCFVQGNYLEAKDFLAKAFDWSTSKDSEARARASMTLGAGFYFADDLAKAKVWLQIARSHAIQSGDIAMQNIILFNSSAMQVARLTLLDCVSTVDPVELKFAVMSAQSAENLNTALGILNQPSMTPVQRAELLTIEQRWQDAIDIFDAHINSSIEQGQSRLVPKYLAQRAWCRANSQDSAGAQVDIDAAIRGMNECTDPDDRSVLHLRVANSARLLGRLDLEREHEIFGRDFLAKHKEHQATVSKCFCEIADSLGSK